MRFWDASGIVPLLTRQSLTTHAAATFEADPQITAWWGTPVECVSALARLEREAAISPEAMGTAVRRLRRIADVWDEVQPSVRIRDLAQRLLRSHSLRGGDALQLAAAIEAAGDHVVAVEFVCFDRRLAEAAGREGFALITSPA